MLTENSGSYMACPRDPSVGLTPEMSPGRRGIASLSCAIRRPIFKPSVFIRHLTLGKQPSHSLLRFLQLFLEVGHSLLQGGFEELNESKL